jgi:glutamate/tyrosine decarboxylase-like PLP-dependent enzyme
VGEPELLRSAAERAIGYLEGLGERSVAPSPEAVAALGRLDEPLPARPGDPAETIELLDSVGSAAATASAGPRFFGFVVGGSLPVAVAASWLATAWDQNAWATTTAPAAARMEEVALRWLLELLGLPAGSAGAFVTGGTVANFVGLAAARQAVLARAGWDVEADGLVGAPPITIVIGEEAHPSVQKSLGLLGLGRERAVRAPVDSQGRMKAASLPRLSGPAIVCVQAGNVNTGAFDPIETICRQAHDEGAWVHVDGAFGLWANASPATAQLCRGIDRADSWATDAHKWLNVPYDSGLAFVRDARVLKAAMATSAAYLVRDEEQRQPSDYVPELSRRARGVEVWAALRSLGREGVAELVERCCRHARRFAEGLSRAGHAILNDVVLNQVLVSFGSAERTQHVVAAIQADGTCWCGPTVWQGQPAMRISVSSWATTDEDVERSLEAMLRLAGNT